MIPKYVVKIYGKYHINVNWKQHYVVSFLQIRSLNLIRLYRARNNLQRNGAYLTQTKRNQSVLNRQL